MPALIGALARRRYAEAEAFGLYDNSNNVANPGAFSTTDAEALQIYRMYTAHRAEIFTYEAAYGQRPDGTGGDRINSVAYTPPFVLLGATAHSLTAELQAAANRLLDTYVNPSGAGTAGVNVLNIQTTWGRNSYTLDGEDNATLTGSSNDLLIGSDASVETLVGHAGDDILVGAAGTDL